ncbi:DUF3987 domain-containing protein [Bacillus sp. ISL-41]|uniref:YfjI family protein n=1 Tax=Bacillus sp. ISL-41 TaxID=2819127 RepID=UPI001BED391F|nr:YfjI family protein [Bacillus sp. ISL-41]MBT2641736.1 DUF3987 domain-containing protein [Bacillus sp. ISL-41]
MNYEDNIPVFKMERIEEEKAEMRKNVKQTSLGSGGTLFHDVLSALNENENSKMNHNENELEWDIPIPFNTYALPEFDSGIFPPTIKEMIDSVAHFTQTPVDLAAFCTFGVLSTALTNKFIVAPKEGWKEPLNTFTTVLLESSNRKSAVFNAMTEPVYLYENDLIDKMKSEVEKRNAERAALEKRIEKLQNDYGKTNDPAIKEEIREVVTELEKIPTLHLPSLLLDNATEEIIVARLKENEEKIAIMSSEGDLFEKLKLKGKDHDNLDVYLKSYSGDHLRVDRVTRPTERLDNPLLTICISAQPTVIQSMPAKINDRGLIPRFLFSIPQDFMGYRDIFASPVPKGTRDRYMALIKKMLNFSTQKPIALTFDKQAEDIFLKMNAKVEVNFREGGTLNDCLKAWGGKLVGQLVRIAGLLHVSTYAETATCAEDIPTTIDIETLVKAVQLKDYFIAHAEKAFGIMNQNQLLVNAEFLLKKVLEKQELIISRQDIWQLTRSRFKLAEYFNRVLYVLESRSYIQRVLGGKLGRKEFFYVNPSLFQLMNFDPNPPNTALPIEIKEKKEGRPRNLAVPNLPKNKTENKPITHDTTLHQKYK